MDFHNLYVQIYFLGFFTRLSIFLMVAKKESIIVTTDIAVLWTLLWPLAIVLEIFIPTRQK